MSGRPPSFPSSRRSRKKCGESGCKGEKGESNPFPSYCTVWPGSAAAEEEGGKGGGGERRDRDARSRPPFFLTLCLYSLLVVHFWRRWPRMIVILKNGQVGSGEWEEMGGAPKKRFGCFAERNTQVERKIPVLITRNFGFNSLSHFHCSSKEFL